VCGPDRAEGDGLRIFPGPLGDRFVAPWVPGTVDVPTVWAALDCPTSAPGFADETRSGPLVLGRLAVRIDLMPEPGARHLITSWGLGDDGRKSFAAAAVHSEAGRCCAVARATWIELAA
jgi:hypothetical protein